MTIVDRPDEPRLRAVPPPAPEATAPATGESASPTADEPGRDPIVQRRAEAAAEVLPAIARVAAAAWVRAAVWSLESSLRTSARLARAATDPDSAARLMEDFTDGLRAYAREFLGIADLDDRVKRLGPGPAPGARLAGRSEPVELTLQRQGRELLRQAADVNFEEEAHPAYARILSEIVPDEGRVLRLLALEGAQPTVDVRASNLIGVGSQLVAPGLNMIGAQAGLRHRDRVAAYLNNLFRLGLIEFSEEPLSDPIVYQVLEAQPQVMEAIRETTRAKTIHRSVQLTPFGEDFCRVCLPLEDLDEHPALPPGDGSGNGQL